MLPIFVAKSYTLPMSKDTEPNDKIYWHPAFFEAIKVELEEYGDDLSFVYQHQLTSEPLRIDVLIIKKAKNAPLRKKIASIFRRDNPHLRYDSRVQKPRRQRFSAGFIQGLRLCLPVRGAGRKRGHNRYDADLC